MSVSDVSATPALFPEPEEKAAESSGISTGGIIPSQGIRELIQKGHIRGVPEIEERQIQPASLDLRLGDIAYRVQASFLPRNAKVEQRINELQLKMVRVDLTRTTLFEKGCVYIVPLCESLELPKGISARANPKSSIGRLDIFTRLITDYGENFEQVVPGYSGRLYAEVASRTFSVVVRAGMALSQLRFIRGTPIPSKAAIERLDEQEPLVWEKGRAQRPSIEKQSLKVSVNLRAVADSPIVAYKARHNAPVIDLAEINNYAPEDFWEIKQDPGARGLILEPGDFYILASKEEISVPPEWAAEMVPMDQDIGEFRIHYAGFFDPGFGYLTGDVKGTHAVLEVRAHEVPFLIEHGQILGRLAYWPLLSRPDKIYGMKIGSSYQRQGLSLSKHFKKL
jgi:dCTP deaminase